MGKSHTANSNQARSYQAVELDLTEIFKAVDERESAEGLTTEEWSEQSGVGLQKTRETIRKAVKAGKMAVGERHVPASEHWAGRNTTYKVYRIV